MYIDEERFSSIIVRTVEIENGRERQSSRTDDLHPVRSDYFFPFFVLLLRQRALRQIYPQSQFRVLQLPRDELAPPAPPIAVEAW